MQYALAFGAARFVEKPTRKPVRHARQPNRTCCSASYLAWRCDNTAASLRKRFQNTRRFLCLTFFECAFARSCRRRTMDPTWSFTICDDQSPSPMTESAPTTRTARRIAIVARLDETKGVGALRRRAPTAPTSLDVVVVGDGPLLNQLTESFASTRVHFFGWCASETAMEVNMRGADAVVVLDLGGAIMTFSKDSRWVSRYSLWRSVVHQSLGVTNVGMANWLYLIRWTISSMAWSGHHYKLRQSCVTSRQPHQLCCLGCSRRIKPNSGRMA